MTMRKPNKEEKDLIDEVSQVVFDRLQSKGLYSQAPPVKNTFANRYSVCLGCACIIASMTKQDPSKQPWVLLDLVRVIYKYMMNEEPDDAVLRNLISDIVRDADDPPNL